VTVISICHDLDQGTDYHSRLNCCYENWNWYHQTEHNARSVPPITISVVVE
jgi:hypothetical protein